MSESDEIESLAAENANLRAELSEAQSENAKLLEELNDVRGAVNFAQADINFLRAHIDEIYRRLGQAEETPDDTPDCDSCPDPLTTIGAADAADELMEDESLLGHCFAAPKLYRVALVARAASSTTETDDASSYHKYDLTAYFRTETFDACGKSTGLSIETAVVVCTVKKLRVVAKVLCADGTFEDHYVYVYTFDL